MPLFEKANNDHALLSAVKASVLIQSVGSAIGAEATGGSER